VIQALTFFFAMGAASPELADPALPSRPLTYPMNTQLTEGAIENFRSLYVDPAGVAKLLQPIGKPKGISGKAEADLPVPNFTMSWAEISINGNKIGVMGPLTHGVIHGVRPGSYEVSYALPNGFVSKKRIDTRDIAQGSLFPGNTAAKAVYEKGVEPLWSANPDGGWVPSMGTLRLSVVDPKGNPVNGVITIDGDSQLSATDGKASVELQSGNHDLFITAPGFQPTKLPAAVKPGKDTEQKVTMRPARAALKQGKVEITEKVMFETGKAVIDAASFELLNDIAELLVKHPEVKKVRIEGHTDNRGNAAANTKLSQDRADAVRTYLTGKGVEVARLDAAGFGPTRPLDPAATDEAWEKNRRVEFMIVEEPAATPAPAKVIAPREPKQK